MWSRRLLFGRLDWPRRQAAVVLAAVATTLALAGTAAWLAFPQETATQGHVVGPEPSASQDVTAAPTDPTPTPPGSTAGNPPAPSAPAAWPGPGNTGPRPGAALRRYAGDTTIRQDGLVLDGVELVDASFDVYASNVTIRNCRISTAGWWGVQLRGGATNLTVENCEISGMAPGMQYAVKNVGGGHLVVRRSNIHNAAGGVVTPQGLVEDNWIHDVRSGDGSIHGGVISMSSPAPGANLVVRHNTVTSPEGNSIAALDLSNTFGPVFNVTLAGNLLAGGDWCVKAGGPTAHHVVVRDNVFTRRMFPTCGRVSPATGFAAAAPGNVWSGNVWEDSRATVPPP